MQDSLEVTLPSKQEEEEEEDEEEEDLASKKKVQQRDGTWYLEEKHEHSRNGAIR